MLRILQARLQQYVNRELSDVQAGFRKGRGTKDQIANISWNIKKERVPEKHLLLLYWLCQSLWLCGSQQTGKFEMGISGHPAFLLRNLYAGQEATVRTGHETVHRLVQIGNGVHQGCLLSPCLFNLYAEYIIWNARLDEATESVMGWQSAPLHLFWSGILNRGKFCRLVLWNILLQVWIFHLVAQPIRDETTYMC